MDYIYKRRQLLTHNRKEYCKRMSNTLYKYIAQIHTSHQNNICVLCKENTVDNRKYGIECKYENIEYNKMIENIQNYIKSKRMNNLSF
jgi:hypothetical protein